MYLNGSLPEMGGCKAKEYVQLTDDIKRFNITSQRGKDKDAAMKAVIFMHNERSKQAHR